MREESKIVWLCPSCGKRVHDHRPFVTAIEGEDGADFGFDGDPLWLRSVRFHEDHFQSRIRGKVYVLVDRVAGTQERPLLDAIRAAYEALNQGDVEPLVALMDRDVEWRGRRTPARFWRPPPS
jgi:hypothetical protein